jgi:hypothetical protein
MLGVSLRTITEDTRNDPCQLGSQIPNIFDYAEDMLIMFCREPKVPVAPMRRLGWIGGTKACVTKQVETRMRRWRANHQSEVSGPARHAAAHHWPAMAVL